MDVFKLLSKNRWSPVHNDAKNAWIFEVMTPTVKYSLRSVLLPKVLPHRRERKRLFHNCVQMRLPTTPSQDFPTKTRKSTRRCRVLSNSNMLLYYVYNNYHILIMSFSRISRREKNSLSRKKKTVRGWDFRDNSISISRPIPWTYRARLCYREAIVHDQYDVHRAPWATIIPPWCLLSFTTVAAFPFDGLRANGEPPLKALTAIVRLCSPRGVFLRRAFDSNFLQRHVSSRHERGGEGRGGGMVIDRVGFPAVTIISIGREI